MPGIADSSEALLREEGSNQADSFPALISLAMEPSLLASGMYDAAQGFNEETSGFILFAGEEY